MTDSKKSTDSSIHESQNHWHERHQRGEVDGYGVYGGAQDQIPERGDPAAMADQQPRVPASQRHGGSHADAEPYRAARVQGFDGDSFYDAARGGDSSNGEMSEQFAGDEGVTSATGQAKAHGEVSGDTAQALATHVTAQLAKAGFAAEQVRVSCDDDSLRLVGHVPDAGTKAAINQIVAASSGKTRIDDRIEVRVPRGQDAQGQGLATATDEYTVLNGRQV